MEYKDLKTLIESTDSEGIAKAIKVISSQRPEIPIDELRKQWDVSKHPVMDEITRPKREVKYDEEDENGNVRVVTKREEVNRVPVPMQKNIVGKAVTFLFGNPVIVKANTSNDQEELALSAIRQVLEDNKSDSQNRVVAKQLFKSTQVVEIWYPEEKEEEHEDYGFKTKFKLRMATFSPWDGSELHPYFNATGDLIAFGRKFVRKDDEGQNETLFEVYTQDVYVLWKKGNNTDWVRADRVANIIKKIPVVFAEQEAAEWADVQKAIERLEFLLSNHADTNDYNGSPTIVAKGKVESFGRKGQTGKIIQTENGADVHYMSWDHAPESIRMEIENLFKIILAYTQTPDISFESVKGLGAISGIALRFLFMDAHLKVMDKREIFDPYLKRRMNIIKSFIGQFNISLKNVASKLKIDSEITPYTIEDVLEDITAMVTANGGKPVISQKASMKKLGLVNDPETDYDQLQEETDKANSFSVLEPSL